MSKFGVWLRGILAGLIAGAANGVTGGVTVSAIRPDIFNTAAGARDLAMVVVGQAAIGAVLGVSAYLKQSPLPPQEQEVTGGPGPGGPTP